MEKLIKLVREGYDRDKLVKKIVKPIKDKEKMFPKSKKEASGDKEEYQKFFNAAMKKFGVKSPAELKGDKEKEFYDYIDKNWKGDHEESVELALEFGTPNMSAADKANARRRIKDMQKKNRKKESVEESVGTNGQSLEADEQGRGLSPKAQFVKSMMNPEVAADANKTALQTFANIMNSVSAKGAPRSGDNTEQDEQ